MAPWIFTIAEKELNDGEKKLVILENNKLLLLRQKGTFYAMSNKSPHMDCPLSKGTFKEYVVECPCHDWHFDIRNGEFIDAKEIKAPIYETKVEDGNIYVNIE
ncbi:MAG: Rieske (2Fe-2S) protein [Methanolobus sp.]|nr:Rieske (2Fe-2S) protein [Methanolobus sp.]